MFRPKSSHALPGMSRARRSGVATSLIALSSASLVLLAGCAINGTPALDGTTASGVALHGHVFGGAQPVVGSTITLYAVGTSGYGSASRVLNTAKVTDGSGSFDITGTYTCAAGDQVYIASTGGNAGSGVNSKLALAAGLGPCTFGAGGNSTLDPNSNITINEVTTVAVAYALAGFATDISHIGTSSTNALGMSHAMQKINNLVNNSSGQALTITPAYASNNLPGTNSSTAPQAKVNTIADLLSSCVAASDANTGACTTLFGDLIGTPTDTFQAALSMAHNPGGSTSFVISKLYNDNFPPTNGVPFAPYVSPASNVPDVTVSVVYQGGGLGQTTSSDRANAQDVDVDSQGNVWFSLNNLQRLGKVDSQGAPVSPSTVPGTKGGFVTPTGYIRFPRFVAIDLEDNAFVQNNVGGGVAGVSSTGVALSATPYLNPAITGNVVGVGIDGKDQIYTTNTRDTISQFSHDGSTVNSLTNGITGPNGGFAFDAAEHIYSVQNDDSNTELNNDGTVVCGACQGASQSSSVRKASEDNLHLWIANTLISRQNNGKGAQLSANSFGLNNNVGAYGVTFTAAQTPTGLILDGAGKAIVVSNGGGNGSTPVPTNVSVLANDTTVLSPQNTGYPLANIVNGHPIGIAADASGSVWVVFVDGPNGELGGSFLQEMVGLAVPVVTPLALQVKNNKLAQRP